VLVVGYGCGGGGDGTCSKSCHDARTAA